MMPFGMDGGEFSVVVLFGLLVWGLPLIAGVWALLTLARVRTDQKEVLTRIVSIERHLTGRS